jgi:hypothetical protein
VVLDRFSVDVYDRIRCVFVLKGGDWGVFSQCNRCWRTRGGRPSGWKIVQEELQPYAAADLGFLHEGQRPYASADLTSPPCWAVVIPEDPNREQDLTPDSPSPSSFQEQILSGKVLQRLLIQSAILAFSFT